MLARKNRFRGRPSLNTVFRRGLVTRGRSMSFRFYSKPEADFRAAVVVSKKVHKSAVVRNRIRRRVYTYLAAHMPELQKGDVIITIHDAELASIDHKAFEADITSALKRSHILS